jgi:phthiocerol/phenolphthiocerol synthesis type-I polyketide synthase C
LSTILLISVEKIDINQSIYDLGLDSLMGLEMVLAIEAKFGVQLPVMILSSASTLFQLAELVIKKLKGESTESEAHSEDEHYLALKHGVEPEPAVEK